MISRSQLPIHAGFRLAVRKSTSQFPLRRHGSTGAEHPTDEDGLPEQGRQIGRHGNAVRWISCLYSMLYIKHKICY